MDLAFIALAGVFWLAIGLARGCARLQGPGARS